MQPSGATRVAEFSYVLLILAVAGIIWHAASALPPAPYDPLGPKTFPVWVSCGLIALGLVMLARLLFRRSLGQAAQSTVIGLEDAEGNHERRPWVAVLTLILAFAYAAGLSFRSIGFLPATAVYLFLSGVILGPIERRRVIIVAIFAVVAAVILDIAFRAIFKLDLN
jgi:hypothetical protein